MVCVGLERLGELAYLASCGRGGPDAPDHLQRGISLDGYIADAGGGFDWIVRDPDVDFAALMARFDTLRISRRGRAGAARSAEKAAAG